jgi:glyoxalase superfamily protein
MAHFSQLNKVVVDVPADTYDAEVAFWARASGAELRQLEPYQEYHGAYVPGTGMRLLTQRLGDGPARVHLDIHTDDVAAEVARLEALGARRVREVNGWWVMEDPAGLPFCVLPAREGSLSEQNAARWD